MITRKSIFILFVIAVVSCRICCSSDNSAEERKVPCGRGCLQDLEQSTCKDKSKIAVFYYSVKEMKCKTSQKCPYDRVYESAKECEEDCKSCHILLKKYKPNDDCMKQVGFDLGSSSTVLKGPILTWLFQMTNGQCEQYDVNSATKRGMEVHSDWSHISGLIFSSKQECEKKCPSVL